MGEVSVEAIEELEDLEEKVRNSLASVRETDCPLKAGHTMAYVWIRSILEGTQREQFLTIFMAFLFGTAIGAEGDMTDYLEEIKQQIAQEIKNTDDNATATMRRTN